MRMASAAHVSVPRGAVVRLHEAFHGRFALKAWVMC